MRIAVIGSGTSSLTLPPHLATLADTLASVEIVHPRLAAFPATPYERLIVDVGYVDAAEQAQQAGFDAVVINSFADYGIEAARAAGVQMAGAGEAALKAAVAIGPRFSIVTIWPASMGHLYTERLRALGLESGCVAVRHVGREAELAELVTEDNVMTRMQRHDVAVFERVLGECRQAIASDRIQSLVLGCTCMAPIASQLAAALDFPVIEGSALAVLRAKQLGTVADRSRTEELTPIGSLVRNSRPLPAGTPGADECEVCVP